MSKENEVGKKLVERAEALFDELSAILGYTKGNHPLKVSPSVIQEKEDLKEMIFDRLCINNLATYAYRLSREAEGKIGIVLKPCDARAMVQLLSEGLIDRDKFKLIVVGCSGTVDYKKILKETKGARVLSVQMIGDDIKVSTLKGESTYKASEHLADKCYYCDISADPPLFDEFIENDAKLDVPRRNRFDDIEALQGLSIEEVYSYWEEEFSSCIRCYACRNVCPMEVCQDQCIVNLDYPSWQSPKTTSQENKFFQMIRVMHMAGRCVECGECERVCPQNLSILKLMKKMNQEIERLFDYKAGMEVEQKPPLLTFKTVESNIKEEELI
jgi:formate dehydrogenase (coenzyme F420) beta subunit